MPSLNDLPAEIIYAILPYTEPDLNPALSIYPLNALAATSRRLRDIVEEHARRQLKKHRNIIPPVKSRKACRRRWLGELCAFCKKNSKRRACFHPALICCTDCDREQFEKMTMTEALRTTGLSKQDLFTPSELHPNLPPLRTGLYPIYGGTATMLSTPDVLARKAYIKSLPRRRNKRPATGVPPGLEKRARQT
ncbi:hypothetical protein A1F94_000218 [Pyrenophora tritici-repentis]|uniref:F-box domain-containing protein n=1 Tax=Pyrenophora tritici-repentis (strain Pt-1C-BFP) TaxID=426418 RepID=B2VQL5_PYRTR|nr:uncharacterized protein PTRG_00566 [Pyrenophora tritici-repentis Pt-1C-BFP]KAF7453568.1 hypothetical protein A1F99_008260 [Pyrenophora tritici-repentis]EDU40004.1 conserved hypothetical protein [Pyrenophora tritici-repentis Pt-1C-BFP]KAG9387326.1 hypothetical protein A1F94_000218 [Pyrenophora tritici-repentis]KAI0574486.1 hypothetical protein Alg130_09673 [Pyrenophora tritici-repentis]KAI0606137.1 hypothetical protein TUN205_09617 [Pyrenophora tritici-repentis]